MPDPKSMPTAVPESPAAEEQNMSCECDDFNLLKKLNDAEHHAIALYEKHFFDAFAKEQKKIAEDPENKFNKLEEFLTNKIASRGKTKCPLNDKPPSSKHFDIFWLTVLMNVPELEKLIRSTDFKALSYLTRIDLNFDNVDEAVDHRYVQLNFKFCENPYFSDKLLFIRFKVTFKAEEKEILSKYQHHQSFEIVENSGINWNEGMDLREYIAEHVEQDNFIFKRIVRDSFFDIFSISVTEAQDTQSGLTSKSTLDLVSALGPDFVYKIVPNCTSLYLRYHNALEIKSKKHGASNKFDTSSLDKALSGPLNTDALSSIDNDMTEE